ncbi:MAG: DUF305 domain-containing protein [Alphaproteobacteria bacterium]|nr:DUF305 domain-containing protein [Alphaproteobacteria bacterium]MBU0831002.1 DUF305 domain-containing protein [Alphaproteobacteria bacterium]MBU1768742.1 DUF305 domain-containing protein [Alphaproteobacteria bacterium]
MSAYGSLVLQTVISGIVMYLVMFVMIDSVDSFYNNLNMFYMTLMMVAPMVVLMILGMRGMFPSKGANVTLIAVSLIAFFGSFALIRTQTTIGDTAFLRSMIPHHSGAILMCREARLTDPEVVRLCEAIEQSQRQEIDEMKAILARQ